MERCTLEEGRKLNTEHYQVGNWYKFPCGKNGCGRKYIKISSIKEIDSTRFEIIGTGFMVDEGKLTNFNKGKEIVLHVWAKHYIPLHTQCSPESVKENYAETLEIFKEDFLSKFL